MAYGLWDEGYVRGLEKQVCELEQWKDSLTDPERKLKAWIDAARALALKCGMPEDETRTTRYFGWIERKLSETR